MMYGECPVCRMGLEGAAAVPVWVILANCALLGWMLLLLWRMVDR